MIILFLKKKVNRKIMMNKRIKMINKEIKIMIKIMKTPKMIM